jgi:hypothetical protein
MFAALALWAVLVITGSYISWVGMFEKEKRNREKICRSTPSM